MRSKTAGMGQVSLVGAGCGSREWITLEGLSLLRSCDAVVYDDLIDPDLLNEAPSKAEKIYVGKRSHKPSAKQEEIQNILINLAGQNKHVVRLKGGDPFVFGRGGEEIQFLNKHHVPWKVVPGISSALAIPAQAGIPVTYRGVSRSIHIITAHTRQDVLRKDMEQFANLEGTLVFLMGLESLAEIVALLKEKGRDPNTPVAILSGGNALHPCKEIGSLDNVIEKAKLEHIAAPAVIVVGDVVALDLYNSARLPLSGVKIGLTGTDDFQQRLCEKLVPLGAKPCSLMRGSCKTLAVRIPWEEIALSQKKWLVFTSVQGIVGFFDRCREEKIDNRSFASCKFAVIGAATGSKLEEYGFMPDLCPKEYTSQALAEELLLQIKEGEKVYLFCSKQGTDLFCQRMQENQLFCKRFDLYDTQFSCSCEPMEKPEYVLFGSAGGVRALQQSGYQMEEGAQGICIGRMCAQAYREYFHKEPVTADEATAEAMVETLLNMVLKQEKTSKCLNI